MKFRTEIEIAQIAARIGYRNRILSLGSCFAERITQRLAQAKIPSTSNPTGILFNPLSIAATIRTFETNAPVTEGELHRAGELWFHYGFHGSLSATTSGEALTAMNGARKRGAEALRTADRVILTFGTAWVYERQGEVVANCHRQPSDTFTRRRLDVEEIVAAFAPLLEGVLKNKEVIFTVSPVRHIGDGLQENAVSKATLRLAVEELVQTFAHAHYFPAYEILIDDLRDYRYYADDLVHPSEQAVEYVWEQFVPAMLNAQAQQLLPRVEQIVAAAAHRPQNPDSEAHKTFCRRMLTQIDALPKVDLQAERDYFVQFLK